MVGGSTSRYGSVVGRREKMPNRPDAAWYEQAPDWVCEVISPSSGRHDRIAKARIYLREGIGRFWLADPEQEIVAVRRNAGDHWAIVGTWGGEEDVELPPFLGVAMELGRWWER